MSTTNFYNKGNHYVICDICGKRRYSGDCSLTWDNRLACRTSNCWYPKHPADTVPPVINDPLTLNPASVRADVADANIDYIDVQGISTWSNIVYEPHYNNLTWALAAKKWANFDDGLSLFDQTQDTP